MIEDFNAREFTKKSLQRQLDILLESYMVVYDEYYETNSRDSAFVKDLVDSLIGICAVTEVYARDGKIHPDYVEEKLTFSKNIINHTIDYFNNKEDKYE